MIPQVPRGFEVLVKKASVDPAFKTLLLDRRAAAADEISLQLEPAEAMMLAATPREQLEAIIARAEVPQAHRRAFLGQAAAAMLAALGVIVVGGSASAGGPASMGNRPDEPEKPDADEKTPGDKDKALDEKEKALEKRASSIVAKHFKVPETELTGDASLVDDLHATPTQLVALKRQLEKQFKWTIPRTEFAKLKTVDDVAGCVKEMVRRRDAAKLPKPSSSPGPTRGIRPDRPERFESGGIRPDRPPPGATGGIRPQ